MKYLITGIVVSVIFFVVKVISDYVIKVVKIRDALISGNFSKLTEEEKEIVEAVRNKIKK